MAAAVVCSTKNISKETPSINIQLPNPTKTFVQWNFNHVSYLSLLFRKAFLNISRDRKYNLKRQVKEQKQLVNL